MSRNGKRAADAMRPPPQRQQENRDSRRRGSTGPRPLEYSSTEVNGTLFPVGKRVKLASGATVEVKPWSIKIAGEMAQRIPNTIQAALSEQPDDAVAVGALFNAFSDEMICMVARTIGWTEERVSAEMTFEDLLLVTNVVWEVCISGPAEKIVGLLAKFVGTVGAPAVLKQMRPNPPQS